MYQDLLFDVQDQIATIKLNRPKVMNAMTPPDTFVEVRDAFRECDRREDVRAVVITGEGKVFSAGGDLDRFKKILEEKRSISAEGVKLSGEMATAARQCSKPIVAMLNGACMGAGMSLAMACDFRVASRSTVFNTSFINIAFSGDTGLMYHLQKMVGLSKLQELMMLGEKLTADDLDRLGLLYRVVEDSELETAAYQLARRLADGPVCAYAKQKELIWNVFFHDYPFYAESECLNMAYTGRTADFFEAVSAFLEKRKPNFKGV